MRKYLSKAAIVLAFISLQILSAKAQNLKLWYDAPANNWMSEALPIGNGYMGVMFFGGVTTEQLQFSEESLWSGGPKSSPDYNFGLRANSSKYILEARKLLAEGKFKEADELVTNNLSGITHPKKGQSFGDFGAQQTMGDLYISTKLEGVIKNYQREIDLENGIGKVSFERNGIRFNRQYFGDYQHKIMVYQLENAKPVDYQIKLSSPHTVESLTYDKNILKLKGHVADNHQEFGTNLHFLTDGKITFKDSTIHIKAATYITIKQAAATEYQNKYPKYDGFDYEKELNHILSKTANTAFKNLYKAHIKDYKSLFDRVKLDLYGSKKYDEMPTNERLGKYHQHPDDKNLITLLYQYGRYLMISSSRPGTLPMNLQGRWNNSTTPPWANDYHMNINLQMLYWPAEVSNLSECHQPLLDYIPTLENTGKKSAQQFFGTRGWVVNTMNNPFGYTAPGWGLPWGYFPGGAAWLCLHLWQHYEYTQDEKFLAKVAYPTMKEAAKFWVDYLSKDKDGYLVSSPSYSPEHGTISDGAAMDHEIAWDIFNNCIQAAQILNIDKSFMDTLQQKKAAILPLKIGKWGQLQEWKQDLDDPNDKHRHVSQLYALYPGNQISANATPTLAKAAKITLDGRGDGGTGWSLAWKLNFWARLLDGNRAHTLLNQLMTLVKENASYSEGGANGGLYSNMLCAHPPFQLDGNMGATAGIAEMLLQSDNGEIILLPALPKTWNQGKISGLKAKGNFEISMEWKNNSLQKGQIIAHTAGICKLKSALNFKIIGLKEVHYTQENNQYVAEFKVSKNKTYTLETE